ISLVSNPGEGSIFTLYLPLRYPALDELVEELAEPIAVGGSYIARRQGNGRLGTIEIGEPSVTTMIAPRTQVPARPPELGGPAGPQAEVPDDRAAIQPDDRVLLIVEDDPGFARILLDSAREKGFKGLIALRGDVGLDLARQFKPDAITLDLQLPVIGG